MMNFICAAIVLCVPLLAHAEDTDCVKQFNLTKSSPGVFAGLGRGKTPEIAVDNARADLAKEISAKITSTSTTKETNRDVQIESKTESHSDITLTDSTVGRRCVANGMHEAVVTLQRGVLLRNLKTQVEQSENRAKVFLERAREAKGSSRIKVLSDAKDYLEASAAASNFDLCKTLSGCAGMQLTSAKELQALLDQKEVAEELGKSKLFQLVGEAELESEVSGEIRQLLAAQGIVVSVDAPKSQVVRLDCSEQLFPKIGSNQVLEITCRAVGTQDGQQKFIYKFAGKGVGQSTKDARVIARNQLEKVD